MDAVKTIELTKEYDELIACDRLNIRVEKGIIYGLVGPNGAGKTSMIKMLCCLTSPSSGEAWVNGFNVVDSPEDVKSSIGYLAENSHLYEDMAVRDYLKFFGDIYGVVDFGEKCDKLLGELDITDRSETQIGNLSKGLKRRVAIARSLLHDPKTLILDEVATGLDPNSSHELRQYLLKQKRNGKTILLSTHNLYEAELLCDRIIILNHGKVVAEGSVSDLKKRYLSDGGGTPQMSLEQIFLKITE